VASLNCQNGLRNIELQMLPLARENDVDVLLLQETEIPDSSADLFSLPDFEVFAEKGKDNVGVLNLVKKNIFDSVTQLEPSSRDRREIWLKEARNICQPTVLVNFYSEWLNGDLVAKQG
jgi:exonuclease III